MLIPQKVTQGDSWSVQVSPPSGIDPLANTLNLALRGKTNADIAGVYDSVSNQYTISISTLTARYEPGEYTYFFVFFGG